jgi:hypothetical protein
MKSTKEVLADFADRVLGKPEFNIRTVKRQDEIRFIVDIRCIRPIREQYIKIDFVVEDKKEDE